MRLGRPIASAIVGTVRGMWETYRLGGRAMWVAPGLVALAVVPEFVQHVAEIRLGMFDSLAAARALANDPTRWAFGYVKLAGFGLAILLLARLWAMGGSPRRAALVRPAVLAKLLAIGALLAVGVVAADAASRHLSGAGAVLLDIILQVWMVGLTIWLVGVLLEDPDITARHAVTERLPTAAVQVVLLAAAFVPAQLLHGLNHRLALGRSPPVVWAMMTFDALLVGLLAALIGAALFVSYDLGATWRGWRRGWRRR